MVTFVNAFLVTSPFHHQNLSQAGDHDPLNLLVYYWFYTINICNMLLFIPVSFDQHIGICHFTLLIVKLKKKVFWDFNTFDEQMIFHFMESKIV